MATVRAVRRRIVLVDQRTDDARLKPSQDAEPVNLALRTELRIDSPLRGQGCSRMTSRHYSRWSHARCLRRRRRIRTSPSKEVRLLGELLGERCASGGERDSSTTSRGRNWQKALIGAGDGGSHAVIDRSPSSKPFPGAGVHAFLTWPTSLSSIIGFRRRRAITDRPRRHAGSARRHSSD